MARKCFYSFHYKKDNWRVSTVRSIGAVEGNKSALDNDWEKVTKGGDKKIKEWIDKQMEVRTCTVVLAGSQTADRKWINYEIKKSWEDGKGVLVVFIHNLKDSEGNQSSKGSNPLYYVNIKVKDEDKKLSTIAKAYNPDETDSTKVYKYIKDNIENWIEEAIKIRKEYK
jgi:hypothetical protein